MTFRFSIDLLNQYKYFFVDIFFGTFGSIFIDSGLSVFLFGVQFMCCMYNCFNCYLKRTKKFYIFFNVL